MSLQERVKNNTHKNPAPQSPFLAPNKVLGLDPELPYNRIMYPCFCSTKYNGIRAVCIKGVWYSRAMKEMDWICQPVLRLFQDIQDKAEAMGVVLDGEFHAYSHNTVGETKSILAGTKVTPEDFYFKVFYALPYNAWNGAVELTAEEFSFCDGNYLEITDPRLQYIKQDVLNTEQEFHDKVDSIRFSNKEGLMILNPRAIYKHGRGTIPSDQAHANGVEGILYKFKFYSDPIDAKITNMTMRKERNADAKGRYNDNLGKADTLHTQADFHDTEVGGVLVCELENGTKVNVPFPVDTGFEEREEYFKAFGEGGANDLKGTWLQFRRLSCEDRDKPISIKDVQFRDSKD
jgi:hypothetical protein